MFDPDLIVAWMADQQNGSLNRLIADVAWASDLDREAARWWVRQLQPLGIADIDWHSGSWQAQPCAVTPLPGRINTALLIGARPAEVTFYQCHGAVALTHPGYAGRIALPSAVWLQHAGPAQLDSFAAAVGASAVPCLADSITQLLEPFRPGPETSPPTRDSAIEMFVPESGRFSAVAFTRARPSNGLYKYTLYGRVTRYALFEKGSWHIVDRRAGIHHVLAATAFPLRWKADPGLVPPKPHSAGQLHVDTRAALPLLQERAAVMCTGLPPMAVDQGQRYVGVPLRIADRVARTLHRALEIT